MTKPQLIAKLTELFKSLGERPTPHLWELFSIAELYDMIDTAKEALREYDDSIMHDDDAAATNDADWFAMGGTRN
jgi:hypothetical protein